MQLHVVCGMVIKHCDKAVLDYLQQDSVQRWPSVEEVVQATGVPRAKVRHTYAILGQQESFYRGRMRMNEREKSQMDEQED